MLLAALLLVQVDQFTVFEAELRATNSATAVLQKRCPVPIRAEVDRSADKAAATETRVRLAAAVDEPVAYRLVRLTCGGRVFSRAENWYLPDRLTPAMNAALRGDTPFGVAIREYAPTRRTVAVERPAPGEGVLRFRALVIGPGEKPIAEVVETYTREAAARPLVLRSP